jgi:formylglycine-generating enzyme required for sulfatase activity
MIGLVSRPACGALLLIALASASCKKADETPPPPRAETFTTQAGTPMIRVPAGWMERGSAAGRPDEAPVRRIYVDAFLIDAYEVAQDPYAALAVVNPSHFKGGNRPVEQVSWAKAAVYCNKRSVAEGLEPCYDEDTVACRFEASGYRLPTEAEWEYACRAGGGPQVGRLDDGAWYAENAGRTTHPVGEKQPNAWGLYDMLGNVAEWCNDVFDEGSYAVGPDANPHGPETGKLRVLRGGAWNSAPAACRPTYRAGENPGFQDACFARDAIGFRCVRRPPPAEQH